MKKYLSLLLVSVFCLTALFGCGKNVKPGDIDGYDEGETYLSIWVHIIEEIDIDKEGKDIMIGFNPKFLIDALKVIDDEEISIYLVNPKAPCFIKNEEESYIYLILPVNFNTAR